MEIKEVAALAEKLRGNVSKVIIGKDDVIDKVTLHPICRTQPAYSTAKPHMAMLTYLHKSIKPPLMLDI